MSVQHTWYARCIINIKLGFRYELRQDQLISSIYKFLDLCKENVFARITCVCVLYGMSDFEQFRILRPRPRYFAKRRAVPVQG